MRLPFSCPHCNTHYQIPSEYSGKTLSCAKCGKHFDIHFEEGAESIAQTEDDSLFVPVDEARFVHKHLNSEYFEFDDQGHFGGDYHKETFPELVEIIKDKLQLSL